MTKADRAELGRYVRWLANELSLRDWELVLFHRNPDDEDDIATCDPTYGRKRAEISFRDDFRTQTPEVQRHTIVHELLHCHFAAMQEFIRIQTLKPLGQGTYDMFQGAYRQALEYGIDGITDGIAHRFPLIDWPATKKGRKR